MHMLSLVKQTIKISQFGGQIFLQHPSLFLFPLFSFLLCCVLESAVLFFIYIRYGIHIFNPETLELWGLLSLWEFGFLVAMLMAPLYCGVTFCMLLAKASLADAIAVMYDDPEHYHWYRSFYKALTSARELMCYAYLKTLLVIVGESGIKKFLRRHVDLLGGRDYIYQARSDNWLEATFLVVPLLMKDQTFLKGAIQKSKVLMEATFGNNVTANFSFVILIFFLAFGVASPIAHLIRAETNGMTAIVFFFLFLALILCTIRSLEGIFHAIVYRFCLKKSTGPFTHDTIVASFSNVTQEDF